MCQADHRELPLTYDQTLVLPAPQSMACQRPPKASPRVSALPFTERTKQSSASQVKMGLYSGSSLRTSARTSHFLRSHDTPKLRPRLSAKALPIYRSLQSSSLEGFTRTALLLLRLGVRKASRKDGIPIALLLLAMQLVRLYQLVDKAPAKL